MSELPLSDDRTELPETASPDTAATVRSIGRLAAVQADQSPLESTIGRPDSEFGEHIENIEISDFEYAEFEDNKARDQAFFSIREAYRDHPKINQELAKYRTSRSTRPLRSVSHPDKSLLDEYMETFAEYRLLKPEEEPVLFHRIERGLAAYTRSGIDSPSPEDEAAMIDLCAAHDVVYYTNFRLAASWAKVYRDVIDDETMIDMIQEGLEGLGRSIRLFDIRKGYKFSTYSSWWIRQSIQRFIPKYTRTIRLPIPEHENWQKMNRFAREYEQRYGKEPSVSEVVAATGLKKEKVELLLRAGVFNLVSLNAVINEENETELGEMIADPDAPEIEKAAERLDVGVAARQIFEAGLTKREKEALCLRFGMYPNDLDLPNETRADYLELIERVKNEGGFASYEEIGGLMGITRSRAQQLIQNSLQRLREKIPQLKDFLHD